MIKIKQNKINILILISIVASVIINDIKAKNFIIQNSIIGQVKDANINTIIIVITKNTIFVIIIIFLKSGINELYISSSQFIYNIKYSCFFQPKKKFIIKYTQPT